MLKIYLLKSLISGRGVCDASTFSRISGNLPSILSELIRTYAVAVSPTASAYLR